MRQWSLVSGLIVAALPMLAGAQPAGGPPPRPDRIVLLHAGTLLAVPGSSPQRRMTVVVRNDRVAAIAEGFLTEPPGGSGGAVVQVVDLSDRFVLPGLMDAHVHLEHEPAFNRRRAERGDRYPPASGTPGTKAEGAVNAMIYARRNLAAGFTTVRDLGSDDQAVFAVRNAINAGRMVGPRILLAGSAIAVTGGHGDSTPIPATGHDETRLADGTCDGAIECRKAVRYQYKLGADVIKFTSTGGFGSNTGLEPQLFGDEIEAIIATAHLLGLKAAAHAYSPVAIKDAVRAGVDSIEHGFLLDDEGIALMKKSGTFLVPTLSASYPPPIFRIPDPPSVKLRNEHRAFERAYAAGVKIAFGTDAGTFTHGDNAKEFGFMVGFGMKPMDALRSATVMTAELFGIAAEAGTLEPGKLADVVAVKGDPLADVATLKTIDFVMKSGVIAKRDGAMLEPFSYPPPSP
ncbi:MAG: amidohydrolase family protein [Gammaproteobacteria bacterium]|nr:amidohydrolase family protein [Gammaproteobacteria bacterium]